MRYIQHRYEQELKGLEKVEREWRGAFNYLKGKLLEQVVQNILSRAWWAYSPFYRARQMFLDVPPELSEITKGVGPKHPRKAYGGDRHRRKAGG